ncbi:DUF6192 family protein [Streptomyces sindenensis]|uniref:DUF6192 family protein n=1 Tax=Streptomyces sindenensis TaxID=67363 RepID=UPI00167859DA|nr:DUF6192 family protein [Streptomyces sindenensis]GGP73000.1 hypothetical protein GCM10010231_49980 [Streptomyces sindenensis]
MAERVGNVSRSRYEQLVAEARELVEQVARAQFGLGDRALEIEPMRAVGGSTARGGDDLFTVEESLQMFADDIGVALSTVEDWRWVASRWPTGKRRSGVSFTVHKILASIPDEAERWVAIEDAPFNPRRNRKQWTTDGAKRLVGQQVDRPVTVEEKVRAVRDLTRDDEVAVAVTASLLSRPETAALLPAAERVRVVQELTRDDEVATRVTSRLLQRPRVAREAMRDDDTRFTVNRAQFDNSEQVKEKVRERMPAVRRIEHTIEYLDLVGSCHSYVATLGRLVPRMRGQEFTDDERATLRRGISKVRGAADWLEAALESGRFTLDEQLAQLLRGE